LFQQRTFSINYPIFDPASAIWTKRSYDKATIDTHRHSALNTTSVTDQQIQEPSESTSFRSPFVWRHKQIQLQIHTIWTNKMHYFLLIHFNKKPLHVSSRLAAHHQGDHLCITAVGMVMHCVDCLLAIVLLASQYQLLVYTGDPPDDKQPACWKHVEAYYWNKLIENSASCWFILYGYITMHSQQNIKFNFKCFIFRVSPACWMGTHILRLGQ